MLNLDRDFVPFEGDHDFVAPEPYCQICERHGHTGRSCPTRDDDPGYDPAEVEAAD